MTTFDRLFAEGAPLVRQRLHQRERPPVDGGRWSVSVVLRPDPVAAEMLERMMTQAEANAGAGHFRTGTADSVHFTVRALELYRESVDDEAVRRYAGALRRAVRDIGPIALDLVGLTLAPGSVMACAKPVDDHAGRLMQRLGDELGDDAWREAGCERDIWYASILHFAADIARPAELVRFHYEDGPAGRLMRPQVLASARTGLENGFADIEG